MSQMQQTPRQKSSSRPAAQRAVSERRPPAQEAAPLGGGKYSNKGACSCGGTCPRCAGKPQAAGQAKPDTASVAPLLRSAGEPLAPALRAQLEPRFGADFGAVRVHRGAQAEASARAVRARAYTVGQHIVFGAGEFAPQTAGGQRTLAHELTHTLQQRQASAVQALSLGPSNDDHEREAEQIASAVLAPARHGQTLPRPQPTPLAVQRLQRLTDSEFESSAGVATGISDGSMSTVNGVDGSSASANNCFGAEGCGIHFDFAKAYKGTYPYAAAGGRVVRGVYVKISARPDNDCWACNTLELVQTLRNTTVAADGSLSTADPGTAIRRQRSGWGDSAAPSRGWRVDSLESSTNPFYSQLWAGQAGNSRRPALLWDSPGDWDSARSVGKDFQTCLICVNGSSRYPLGCVSWGYAIDAAGTVRFTPTPAASCGGSTQLRDAASRWDAIEGNQDVNLDNSSPPRPAGETPRPPRPGDSRVA